MSKIAKFISSALNNSSANEAAQALKMAAVTMQKEGVNPAELLQHKGDDNRADMEALKAQLAESDQALKTLRIKAIQLEKDLTRAKRSGSNPAELREAKELAIKWHKAATSLDDQLTEMSVVAVQAQNLSSKYFDKAAKWKSRCSWGTSLFGFIGLIMVIHISDQSDDIAHLHYSLKSIQNHMIDQTAPKPVPTPKPAVVKSEPAPLTDEWMQQSVPKPAPAAWHPKGGVYSLNAQCDGSKGKKFNVSFSVDINKANIEETTKILPNPFHVTMVSDRGLVRGEHLKVTLEKSGVVRDCVVVSSWE